MLSPLHIIAYLSIDAVFQLQCPVDYPLETYHSRGSGGASGQLSRGPPRLLVTRSPSRRAGRASRQSCQPENKSFLRPTLAPSRSFVTSIVNADHVNHESIKTRRLILNARCGDFSSHMPAGHNKRNTLAWLQFLLNLSGKRNNPQRN